MHDSVPCCDSSAGQRRGFFPAQVFGNLDQSLLIEHDVFSQHTVDVAAERAALFGGIRRAVDPVLHEDAGHALADLYSVHSLADRNNLAGSIRTGNARQSEPWIVLAEYHQQVAIVQRHGMYPDQSLTVKRLWRGPRLEFQVIDAEGRNLPELHSVSITKVVRISLPSAEYLMNAVGLAVTSDHGQRVGEQISGRTGYRSTD